jgi:hypothetical protein
VIFDHVKEYVREMNATIFFEDAAKGHQLYTGCRLKEEIVFD